MVIRRFQKNIKEITRIPVYLAGKCNLTREKVMKLRFIKMMGEKNG